MASRWRMAAYYVGIIVVGLLTIVDEPPPQLAESIGHDAATLVFGALYAALGVCALVARLSASRRAESTLIRALAIWAAMHGVLMMMGGSEAGGLRIGIAVLMMWDYARMHEGITLSAQGIRHLGDRDA